MTRPRAAVIGLSGPVLTGEEAELLRDAPPLGIILFATTIAGLYAWTRGRAQTAPDAPDGGGEVDAGIR